MQPMRPHQHLGPGCSSALAQGSGLWPHSPPMPRGPSMSAPSSTSPPPQPVPRMTPNTPRAPAPAPSTASDRAKQLASLASRTGRPRCASRSRWNGLPLSHVELAFCTSPLAGATEPGMPMPTAAALAARAFLERAHHLADGPDGRAVVVARRRHAMLGQRASARAQRHARDLGAAEVDADAQRGLACFGAVMGAPRRAGRWRGRRFPAATAAAGGKDEQQRFVPSQMLQHRQGKLRRAGARPHLARLQPGKLKKAQHARCVLGQERKPLQRNGFGRFSIEGGRLLSGSRHR